MSALEPFFHPRSIAFVGASNDPARIGGRPLAYCLRDGFSGRIFPINAGRDVVQGIKAFPDLLSVPDAVDLVVIAIPATEVVSAIRDAASRGVRAAVVLSSGFAEIGDDGANLQDQLVRTGREAGLRIIGPNSLGLISNGNGVCATFSSVLERGPMKAGPLAIVSQSGAYGAHLAMLALARGVGIARFATTGNEADVSLADCIAHMASDPDVGVIGCYSEGISDGQSLLAALEQARRAGKPVVMMKVGRSPDGRQAAQSHTASVAGDDAVFDAAVKEVGLERVDTTQEFVDLLYTLCRRPPVTGPKLGVVTVSGGAGVLMADAAAANGFGLPPLPAEAQARLKVAIPFGSATNPVDTTAQAMNDLDLVGQAVGTMLEAGYDAVAGFFMNWPDSPALGPKLRSVITGAMAGRGDRTVAVAMNASPETSLAFDAAGLLVFDDPTHAIRALAASRRLGEALARRSALRSPVPPAAPLAESPLDEFEATQLLRAFDIPMHEVAKAADANEVADIVAGLARPAVLKILSPDIQHKSDVGGVALNLRSPADAAAAADAMLRACHAACPTADLRGFLVSPFESGVTELLLGGRIDPVFGPVVVCGLGGVFVEIFNDVAIGLAPLDEAKAESMLRSLKGWPLLAGARGRPAADVAAAAKAISDFSRFVAAYAAQIDAVEINPLLVRPAAHGVVGLDAVIVRAMPRSSTGGVLNE